MTTLKHYLSLVVIALFLGFMLFDNFSVVSFSLGWIALGASVIAGFIFAFKFISEKMNSLLPLIAIAAIITPISVLAYNFY